MSLLLIGPKEKIFTYCGVGKMNISKIFKDWNDCKQIVLEMDSIRRGKIENVQVWDRIIDFLYQLDSSDYTEKVKIDSLIGCVSMKLALPINVFPKAWLIKNVPEIRNRIEYYKNNPEEEE